MAINLGDNLKINVGKPIDDKYLNGLNTYASVGEVESIIPLSQRYIGLTVNVNFVEYWFKNGIDDSDLILKTTSGGGSDGVVSGATVSGTTLILSRTENLPDVTVDIGIAGGNDGVVSGGTVSGDTLILNRTQSLSNVNIDISSLTDRLTSVEITSGATINIPDTVENITYVASGTTEYILPASPLTGAKIVFVDGIGDAGDFNIIIDGNGKIIYDDTFALINTDNGSITIIYNGYHWNVTSFVI